MNLSFFVAFRYFFSKKKLKVINIISMISMIGIAITTAALLIVLSVFNGFTFVGEKVLSLSNPPLIVEPNKGKVFSLDTIDIHRISSLKEVSVASAVLTENALATFGSSQALVRMKGIDSSFFGLRRIDTSIVYGKFELERFGNPASVLGIGLMGRLGLSNNADMMGAVIKLAVPKRSGKISPIIEETFSVGEVIYNGCFMMNASIDETDVFLPIGFVRDILEYENNEISAIYVSPKKEKDIPKLKEEIQLIVGKDYSVKNILEQDPLYQKVVRVERWGVYAILSFIIFVASFNVMGSLSLLIMDKKKDILILRSMGASLSVVRKIYFYNGLMLSVIGALVGLILGAGFCLVQQHFGLIKMGGDNLIVDAFPIVLKFMDIISIFLLVLSIGIISVAIMVSRIKFDNNLNQ
ncbi:MAG: ABC transporter permease [Bacteroidales bacterium]|jgi:lipoprotein-releasing system permease protein|nr:ABC transporter permease [Bacteroidales bacterium]MDX9797620.1 ABC transporter permease [Bacteroidales bacterium]